MVNYETDIVIDAPPAAVWKHLTDFGRHDEWSHSFKLRGQPVVGSPARVELVLFGRSLGTRVTLDRVDEEHELRWRGGPKGLATGSHYFILESRDGGGATLLRHGETFAGLLAPLVWAMIGPQLRPQYASFNRELKRRVEGG
ncbi:MAG: SRPBCC domain-containing protein [Polyangiales bacterium]